MNRISPYRFSRLFAASLILALACAANHVRPAAGGAPPPPRPWVTAYYAIWQQRAGQLPPQAIDYRAFSHLIQFSVLPGENGGIDQKSEEYISADESAAVLAPAHAAGRKVLACVGGADSAPRFRAAFRDSTLPVFVETLAQFVTARGYDGLDIDMEPLESGDAAAYARFIYALRRRLRAANPRLLLTAATASQPKLFAGLQAEFDQINLMTYDLSGPWEGWQTWHNAALTNTVRRLQSTGALFPSVESVVQDFVHAGVAPGKLGVGIDFYGDVWQGASGPEQSIDGVTCTPLAYAALMDAYAGPGRFHWDAQAQAPYLSVDSPRAKDRLFVSYDNETLCARKVAYARRHHLGGAMIWELSGGYCPSRPAGQRDPLLQAVKRAWLAP